MSDTPTMAKIVNELTKSIYDTEIEREKFGQMYGKEALNSHYFRYEVMEDNVNEIAAMYGISYENAVKAFEMAWVRAHDMIK